MAERLSDLPLRKKIVFYLSVWLGWLFIVLLCRTYRFKVEGAENLQKLRTARQPFLLVIWHGRFFIGVDYFRFWHLVVLVSQHLDGEMIARNLWKLGFDTVRGSSTRGGKEAFHKMVDLLRDGRSGVIIPDGPTGPRHQLKPGVIYMSHQAQIPIVPFTFSAQPAIVFNSWDRFMLPKPFARVLVKIGEPIWPPREAGDEELIRLKKQVESRMIKQEQEADAYFSA